MATPRSLELLHHILSIYPILETILSSSHRGSVIQLARSSKSLQSLLSSSIKPLQRPFPLCASPLKPCYHCHVPLCRGCKHEVKLPEGPSAVISRLNISAVMSRLNISAFMSRLNIGSAIVSKHKPGSPERQKILTCIRWLIPLRPVVRLTRGVEIKDLCDSCLAVHNKDYRNKLVKEVEMALPILEWTELPHAHATCKCRNLDCEADQHLVQIDCVPRDSVLVAFVKGPPGNEAVVSVYLPN
ncbi:hypothetical protein L211DRAFT_852923 [Terfezia boudieri ATCC MYA-4762]|uniref:Uncharacterized protein n=1 Tax=Terfezia boudieri ATCC MYA-4762 TaxID=1051890 RepID=A0A3N4LA46_9PEZI|nr:hypothetical protein L211DRAFT_852923 [Terfezia boudieri ATCC MYA-4762]